MRNVCCLGVWFLCMIPIIAHAGPQDQARWNAKYGTDEYVFGTQPIQFLRDHVDLLPQGKALDIAMGEGRNGVFLATRGFDVTGIDISNVGLEKAKKLAADQGVSITTKVVDLEGYQLENNAYDVIVMAYYMQRDLFSQIKAALKPGGMAVVETYTMDHLKYRPTFRNQWLLQPNELLEQFADCKVIRYQASDDGENAYASILVQKS